MRLPLLLATTLLAAGASACGGEGAAGCVAVVRVDGVSYYGQDEPQGSVPTTGETRDAVVPGCHDTGVGDDPDEDVRVRVIDGVQPAVAVLHDGVVHVREGARLPRSAGAWDVSLSCAATGRLRVEGGWETVSEPHAPHFDGVLDPPYEMGIRVAGGPRRLLDRLVDVQVTDQTHPVLPRSDLDLLGAADIGATVRCDQGEFHAVAVELE